MLAYQWHHQTGRSEKATPIVFLHGLLGSQQDWQPVIDELQKAELQKSPQFQPLTIDLPFHGLSAEVRCRDFVEMRHLLDQTLTHCLGEQPFYLVGYSLGGRVAMDYVLNMPAKNLLGVVLEGANVGLNREQERQSRQLNDQKWAVRFRQEPIEQVLKDWYQQAVFADLEESKRSFLIEKRRMNSGTRIAEMLEATGLAKQPYYLDLLKEAQTIKNILFFIGERDQKFRQMVEQNQFTHQIISQAGHNAHQANPSEFVRKLIQHFQSK